MAFNTALFARMPRNKVGHSQYKRPFIHAGTMMHGDIVPIYCKLVSPGEVIKEKIFGNVRLSTPITPLYSSIKISFNAFFVPLRLVWEHTKEFFGENTSGTTPIVGTYTIPQHLLNNSYYSDTQVKTHSISHYLGKPLYKGSSIDSAGSGATGPTVSCLKERAYWAIINRWYRHEQVQNPIIVSTSDSGNLIAAKNGYQQGFDAACQKCLKDFDYFTTMTKDPQFGPDVSLPLGTTAPVITSSTDINLTNIGSSMHLGIVGTNTFPTYDTVPAIKGGSGGELHDSGVSAAAGTDLLAPTNLVADLSRATAATIDELYLAMAAQAWYHNSNYGARYFEMLEIHYSVSNPDLVLNEPEHIGEAKRYIQVQQVLSTAGAAGDATTKLGQPGANSSTNIEVEFPKHSFGEWGYFMVLANTYHERYYPAGVMKEDLYTELFDFFFPEFSNIGDQGVREFEAYFASGASDPEKIIGFQEAWSEMRYSPNRLSGCFDPYADSNFNGNFDPLKGWVLAEKYPSAPTLSESFLLEDRDAISKALVTTTTGPDYMFYFYFDEKTLNEVPLYSVPGLPGRGRGLI